MLLLLLNGHKAIVSACGPIYLVFQSSEKLDGLFQLVNEVVDLSAKQHETGVRTQDSSRPQTPSFHSYQLLQKLTLWCCKYTSLLSRNVKCPWLDVVVGSSDVQLGPRRPRYPKRY